jgi:hypothetical protein
VRALELNLGVYMIRVRRATQGFARTSPRCGNNSKRSQDHTVESVSTRSRGTAAIADKRAGDDASAMTRNTERVTTERCRRCRHTATLTLSFELHIALLGCTTFSRTHARTYTHRRRTVRPAAKPQPREGVKGIRGRKRNLERLDAHIGRFNLIDFFLK